MQTENEIVSFEVRELPQIPSPRTKSESLRRPPLARAKSPPEADYAKRNLVTKKFQIDSYIQKGND